jgi:RNA polymerase sigma-70 factor (ECF subfamily)
MRDVEGYELEEIADITGVNPAAVRVNLSRARKTVRDKFININQAKR